MCVCVFTYCSAHRKGETLWISEGLDVTSADKLQLAVVLTIFQTAAEHKSDDELQ